MSTISAWDIYWVMQLDTIGKAAGLISFLGLILLPFCIGFSIFEVKRAWAYFACAGIFMFWTTAVTAAIFLPSSKTAAAMIVIPAIANNETIQREAGDLYQIAKDGLRELIKPDAPKESRKV